MLEPGRGLDLGEEALRPHHRGQLGLQHLQGHVSVVAEVTGQIHGGHPAFAHFPLHQVSVGQGRVEPIDDVHGPHRVR